MMSHRVISDDGLKAQKGGYSIAIRIPWYRSLPLSVIEVMEIEVDGKAVPLDSVSLSLEGEEISLQDLPSRTDDMWFVRDNAFLRVGRPDVGRGEAHEVAVTLAIYPPYIKGYKRITRTQKTLVAR